MLTPRAYLVAARTVPVVSDPLRPFAPGEYQPGVTARPGTGHGLTCEASTSRTTASIAATTVVTAALIYAGATTAHATITVPPAFTGPGAHRVIANAEEARVQAAEAHRAHVRHVKHRAHVAAENYRARHAAASVSAAPRTAAYAGTHRGPAETVAQSYSGSPQATAEAMLGTYGWNRDQMPCLVELWDRESGWNAFAENAASGAYGIPQALPGSKMASAGADWRTDAAVQIRWGFGYIKADYGSPCGALQHSNADGWY